MFQALHSTPSQLGSLELHGVWLGEGLSRVHWKERLPKVLAHQKRLQTLKLDVKAASVFGHRDDAEDFANIVLDSTKIQCLHVEIVEPAPDQFLASLFEPLAKFPLQTLHMSYSPAQGVRRYNEGCMMIPRMRRALFPNVTLIGLDLGVRFNNRDWYKDIFNRNHLLQKVQRDYCDKSQTPQPNVLPHLIAKLANSLPWQNAADQEDANRSGESISFTNPDSNGGMEVTPLFVLLQNKASEVFHPTRYLSYKKRQHACTQHKEALAAS